jgi:hypothetical protein
LQTVRGVIDGNTDKTIVFLTGDGLLRRAATQQLSYQSHFVVHETFDEFLSFLVAARSRFSAEFIQDVIRRAPTQFYAPENEQGFWLMIDAVIRDFYAAKLFRSVSPAIPRSVNLQTPPMLAEAFRMAIGGEWIPQGEPEPTIGSTKFLRIVKEREFRWTTEVHYSRRFERTHSGLLAGAMGQKEWASVTWTVQVDWRCRISDKGDFSNFELIAAGAAQSDIEIRGE